MIERSIVGKQMREEGKGGEARGGERRKEGREK